WSPALVVGGCELNASGVGTTGAVGPRSHVARNSEDTRRAAPRSSRASKAEEGARMVVAIGQCSWTYISLPRLGLRNSHWGLGDRLNACVGRKGCAPRSAGYCG